MKMRTRDILFMVLIVSIVAATMTFQFTGSPSFSFGQLFSGAQALNGVAIDPPQPMPDFTLTSAQGPVSLSTFRGKMVVLYFGYTSCPDVCPLTLSYLRQAINGLGSKAKDVQVIFISVDWNRDTPEKLASYATTFHPDFIGLTGTQEQIDQVTKDFGIFYLLNPPDKNGYYSVDHTAKILLLDRQGNLVLTWADDIEPENVTADLRKLAKK